jgi:hypothetical protein
LSHFTYLHFNERYERFNKKKGKKMKNIVVTTIALISFAFGSTLQIINASKNSDVAIQINGVIINKNFKQGENFIIPSSDRDPRVKITADRDEYEFNLRNSEESAPHRVLTLVGINNDTRKTLKVVETKVKPNASARQNIDLKVLNASGKHESIDIYIDGVMKVENVNYSQYSEYISLPIDAEVLNVHIHGEDDPIFHGNTNVGNLVGQTGIMIVRYATNNQNSNLELSLVMTSGKTVNLKPEQSLALGESIIILDPATPIVEDRNVAQAQIVHNSPSPAVDIYVDGTLAVENFTYRSSTGLVDLPLNTVVGIAPTGGDIIAEFPFTLEQSVDYVVVASGILNDATTPFTLLASVLEQDAESDETFALKVLHGVTDAPAVDIYANGGLLIENLVYGDFTDYLQVPVGDYTIDITAHGAQEAVASFSAPLTGLGGGSGVLYASGFLAGEETDPAFSLVLTTPSSYVVELPATETVLDIDDEYTTVSNEFALLSNYPNPFNPVTSIRYNLDSNSNVKITVYDLLGNVVNELFQGAQMAGINNVSWNATNNVGESISSGVYIYKIQTDASYKIGRMMFLK